MIKRIYVPERMRPAWRLNAPTHYWSMMYQNSASYRVDGEMASPVKLKVFADAAKILGIEVSR